VSYDIGMKIVDLEMTDRVGRTEYCDHPALVQHVTGRDARSDDPKESQKAWQEFRRWANFDFLWFHNAGPTAWRNLGRTTDMGHAVYAQDGTDFRDTTTCPFKTPEEALNFDAADEYGLPDIDQRAKYYQKLHQNLQKANPTMVVPGGYYPTLISGCIASFGWEICFQAVGTDPVRFGEYVLEGFFRLTLANVRTWANAGIKVFIQHDDIVWSAGAIFQPDWYRRYVFPRYLRLWQPLKENGIKILYCSDGKFTEFIDDIAQAEAHGFIFEPLTSLELIGEEYGQTHVIIGNADRRAPTFGTKEDIEKKVKRCLNVGKPCPGFIMAVGNHVPANIPLDKALYYFEFMDRHARR